MKVLKTQEELLTRIKEVNGEDAFGTQTTDLVCFLEYKHAQPFLNANVTEEEWATALEPVTKRVITTMIKDYAAFAWDKANEKRGLSASRSIEHFKTYLWLYGDMALLTKFNDTPYEHYGKEKLIVVCDAFRIDWKRLDNGERTNG